MRENAPFRAADLAELDERLLSRAEAVIAMEDVYDGDRAPNVIGLRHDVDAGHALETAVKMARWEADRGYRSTYYLLHTSPYWQAPGFEQSVARIAGYGHEIGIHADALAEALVTGRDPDVILDEALEVLRGMGYRVRGVAGHGNPLCNRDRGPGEITFANDEQFVECARPQEGEPDRTIIRGLVSLTLKPRPLADFGLDYEALKVAYPLPFRCSDSGGRWLRPGWEEMLDQFERSLTTGTPPEQGSDPRQLHFLQHPDWWGRAFASVEAVAA